MPGCETLSHPFYRDGSDKSKNSLNRSRTTCPESSNPVMRVSRVWMIPKCVSPSQILGRRVRRECRVGEAMESTMDSWKRYAPE